MCVEYETVKDNQRFIGRFGVAPPGSAFKASVFPLDLAPMIRRLHTASNNAASRECVAANFGLVPHWVDDTKIARKTYNARTETVASKPSYRVPWRKRQFCIVPMEAFYEPNWESGHAVRWRIGLASGEAFGVAGIWDWWPGGGADGVLSFSMLTINADEHGLMRRFHRPGDEKRMLVILEPSRFDAWLNATAEEAPAFFVPYPEALMSATAAPRPASPRPPIPRRRTEGAGPGV